MVLAVLLQRPELVLTGLNSLCSELDVTFCKSSILPSTSMIDFALTASKMLPLMWYPTHSFFHPSPRIT